MVSKKTRQPVALPDDWKAEFMPAIVGNERLVIRQEPVPDEDRTPIARYLMYHDFTSILCRDPPLPPATRPLPTNPHLSLDTRLFLAFTSLHSVHFFIDICTL